MLDHSARALAALIAALGPGTHQLICTAPDPDGGDTDAMCLPVRVETEPVKLVEVDTDEMGTFILLLAAALTEGGALMSRTTGIDGPDILRAWTTSYGWPIPCTAAEVFAAHCTDPDSGEPMPPDPHTRCEAGIRLVLPI